MYEFTVELDLDPNVLVDKFNEILDDKTLTEIQTVFAQLIDPWTPFLSGELHENISIDSEGVTYNVPYASEKYYGTVYTKTHHPLATSHWDEVAMETQIGVLEEKVKDILIAKVRELYG